MGSFDSVGSLLADIASSMAEGLRTLSLADKRYWTQDEHELLRALEDALDDAKTDFQSLAPFIKGQTQYENDRNCKLLMFSTTVIMPNSKLVDSIQELRTIRTKYLDNAQNLKDWCRSGGAVDPTWTRITKSLQNQLHRAQCRAARRVFMSQQESSQPRCLGAFIVHRQQRVNADRLRAEGTENGFQKKQLDDAMICKAVGGFERLGELDVAFICNFCDGHLVWEDVERIPTTRTAWDGAGTPPTDRLIGGSTQSTEWQATGIAQSNQREKQVVFAPMAVANHAPPIRGDWQARLLCPLCEEEGGQPLDVDDEDMWRPETEYEDLAALQEHLEWQHPPAYPLTAAKVPLPSTNSCVMM